MSLPSLTAEVSLYHSRHHYRVHDQYPRPETNTIVPAQRCPFPCYEGTVACIPTPIPFLSAEFHACWCPDPNTGRTCPQNWWYAGACFGAWLLNCYP
jgi:hypothetical protein